MANAKKYKTLLSKSQEEINKEELSHKEEEAKLQLSADILATKRSLSQAKRQLELVKGAFPFDSQGILDASDEVENIQNTIERLEGLKSMF